MFCVKCGKTLPTGAKFCVGCGARVQVIPVPVPEPIPEPTPEPVPEPIPEPVPEPIPEAVLEPVPEPISESAEKPAPITESLCCSECWEYRVLSCKDAQLDLNTLENSLNTYARQGWHVIHCTETMIILERKA